MKKIFAVALVAMMALTANAQVFVGGAVGYNSTKASKNAKSVNSFVFTPEVGYNINEDWTVGVTLDYQSTEANDQTLSGIGAGIYGRYNYLKSGMVTLFVEAGVDFLSHNHSRGTEYSVALRPGLSVALSEKLSLVAKTGLLGYSKESDKLGGGSNFGIGVDNTDLSFGLYYNF